MKLVCAATHIGQLNALSNVLTALDPRGHEITVILAQGSPAYGQFEKGTASIVLLTRHLNIQVLNLGATEVVGQDGPEEVVRRAVEGADKVLVTMSPTKAGEVTAETLVAKWSIGFEKPLFGYAEVPCGHLGEQWRGRLADFTRLFVAQQTEDLMGQPSVVEVGCPFPMVNPVRAVYTKQRLGIDPASKFIWCSGGPYHQAGNVLKQVITFVWGNPLVGSCPIIFSRHRRDKDDPKSLVCYQEAVKLAETYKVPLIENSLDHDRGEITALKRRDPVPYNLILEACLHNGVIVTGHGTDGAIHAPRMGIPSILCVGKEFNPHIVGEKGCERLPLPECCPHQVTSVGELEQALRMVMNNYEPYVLECARRYKLMPQSPSEIIAEHLLTK